LPSMNVSMVTVARVWAALTSRTAAPINGRSSGHHGTVTMTEPVGDEEGDETARHRNRQATAARARTATGTYVMYIRRPAKCVAAATAHHRALQRCVSHVVQLQSAHPRRIRSRCKRSYLLVTRRITGRWCALLRVQCQRHHYWLHQPRQTLRVRTSAQSALCRVPSGIIHCGSVTGVWQLGKSCRGSLAWS
jgi:hypothetical protein